MKTLYAETNLLLTLVRDQEQAERCERILKLAEGNRLDLRIPAFSVAEACRALYAQHVRRDAFAATLHRESAELDRSRRHRETLADPLRKNALNLWRSLPDEWDSLRRLRERLVGCVTFLPTDDAVVRRTLAVEQATELDPSDATVLAAVLVDFDRTSPADARFVTANTRDFFGPDRSPRPEIEPLLTAAGCGRTFGDFASAGGWAAA